MSKMRLGLFLALALIQMAVPVWMIVEREQILHQGEIYRFKTAPVDPYDLFQGRYVALRFESDRVPVNISVEEKQWVYVTLKQQQGFAEWGQVSLEKPDAPYLYVKLDWVSSDKARLDLPFDRYYMNEELAQEAEEAYAELNRNATVLEAEVVEAPSSEGQTEDPDSAKTTGQGVDQGKILDSYAQVRILNGKAVLEELYLQGEPVYRYLQRRAQESGGSKP